MTGAVIDRRQVMAGGLLLGLANGATAASAAPVVVKSEGQLNAYVAIARDGAITIVTPGAEMGQGVANGMPKIVAEELDADWSRVEVRLSEANPAFASPKNKRQRSANSDGITSYYDALRMVGATARAMLIAAAARRWNIDPARITTRESLLFHPDGQRRLGYGEVAVEAALLPVPANVPLKDPARFTLIGRDFPRKDIPAKVMGTARFGMDVVLPGMLYATVQHVPVAGAGLGGFSTAKASAMPGVRRIVKLDDAVGVIADSYWQARQAADVLQLQAVPGERLDSRVLTARIRAALDQQDGILPFPVAFGTGHPDIGASAEQIETAMASAPWKIEATYEVPYLAHATMEPLCCTALVEPDRCQIWGPLQCADVVPGTIAALTGLPASAVTVNRTFLGGGFGRKNECDFVIEAVKLAQAVPGRPVMTVWSREEDTRNDYYRPAFAARMRAAVNADGTIAAMHGRIAGQPLLTSKQFRIPGMADFGMAGDLIAGSYPIALRKVEAVEVPAPLRTGYWRSVSASQNGFFFESAIDEIAALLKRDPLSYRKALSAHDPRSLAVLDLVAQKSGWGRALPAGHGMGIALSTGWNARCAQVVEVAVSGRKLSIERIVCAFDCGHMIDPDNVIAQMEGGITFGLSAALFGKITLKDGAVEQANFADYPVVQMRSAPPIEVHLVNSGAPLGGVGETGVPAVAPALAGAIAAATGTRVRRLPVIDAGFEVSI